MIYKRVIPRDLFNESALLQCWGRLGLAEEQLEAPGCGIFHDTDYAAGFEIEQELDSGAIYVMNLVLVVNKEELIISRPLNSRSPFALYCVRGEGEASVLNDVGELAGEFVNFLKKIAEQNGQTS